MLRTVLCSTLALVAGSAVLAHADAKEDATAAAQKLGDAQNYSWKQTVESAGGGGGRGGFGNMEGKTEKGGVTMTSAQRGDNTVVTYRKGDKVVMQNPDGDWMTAEEMAAARAANGNGGGGGQRRGRGGPPQFRLPAETASDLISKANDLAAADGVITGNLSEDAIKQLLAGGRGRRGGGAGGTPPEISNAKGTVKVWTKDGAISKFEYHVTGTVSRNGNDTDVDRTTTVEITDVGSTKIDVPEAAAKKLG
jgi:hypothetical protein